MYQRKTRDEFQIHGNYGYGFEEVTAEDTRKEAMQRLREYRENEPGVPFKLVTKRIAKEPIERFRRGEIMYGDIA